MSCVADGAALHSTEVSEAASGWLAGAETYRTRPAGFHTGGGVRDGKMGRVA